MSSPINPIIVGNWKMNATIEEAKTLVAQLKLTIKSIKNVDTVVCPPFTALSSIRELLANSAIGLGAQDMYHEITGSFTGEISPSMLSELCEFVILGHSERRSMFGETDQAVCNKISSALKVGLKPIMCVGETLTSRQNGNANADVEQQIILGLKNIEHIHNLVIAYEPIWAIGQGKPATPTDAQNMMSFIRKTLSLSYGESSAKSTPILYGGSVTADNVCDFLVQVDIDGALVGGASLNHNTFSDLVINASNTK
jgi:triosephosphate isomerase